MYVVEGLRGHDDFETLSSLTGKYEGTVSRDFPRLVFHQKIPSEALIQAVDPR
jgi:hypothetical protein